MKEHNQRQDRDMPELSATEMQQIHGGDAIDSVDGVDGERAGYHTGTIGWVKVSPD
jgi:hypothetical protein